MKRQWLNQLKKAYHSRLAADISGTSAVVNLIDVHNYSIAGLSRDAQIPESTLKNWYNLQNKVVDKLTPDNKEGLNVTAARLTERNVTKGASAEDVNKEYTKNKNKPRKIMAPLFITWLDNITDKVDSGEFQSCDIKHLEIAISILRKLILRLGSIHEMRTSVRAQGSRVLGGRN